MHPILITLLVLKLDKSMKVNKVQFLKNRFIFCGIFLKEYFIIYFPFDINL